MHIFTPKRLAVAGMIFTLLSSTAVYAGTGRTGIQLIGLQALAGDQVDITADILAECPANHDCELHFLAYDFDQKNPAGHTVGDFRKAERLIKRTLPALNDGQKLFVAVSLDDGPNRAGHQSWVTFRNDLSVTAFWKAVKANNDRLADDWKQLMVTPFSDWASSVYAWADANGYGNRLQLVIVPVLEDRCRNKGTFQQLIDWTQQGLGADVRYRVQLRRNPLSSTARISGVPMEFHTTNTRKKFFPGDVVSNDGTTVNGTQWRDVQTNALSKNASALLWRPEFNANQYTVDRNALAPWERGTLRPFEDSDKVSTMKQWIRFRPNGL